MFYFGEWTQISPPRLPAVHVHVHVFIVISQRDTALHQLRRVASCSSLEKEREEEVRNKLRNEIILLKEENRFIYTLHVFIYLFIYLFIYFIYF